MKTKIEVTIPKFDNDGFDNARTIDTQIRSLTTAFGGLTLSEAKGYWVDKDGTLYEDEVVILTSYTDETPTSAKTTAKVAALQVLDETDQKAILVVVNGKAELVERDG